MLKMLNHIQDDLCKFLAKEKFDFSMLISLLNPRFLPVLMIRMASMFYRSDNRVLSKITSLKNQIIFGCDVGRGAQIEGGLYLPHPCGVVIGEFAVIGKNCIIHQGVTLGAKSDRDLTGNPAIGNEVEIGTGAKLLGRIIIGNYAKIGANSVVTHDIPDYAIAVGNPAKIIGYRKGRRNHE